MKETYLRKGFWSLLGYEHYLVDICLAISQAKTTYSQTLTAIILLNDTGLGFFLRAGAKQRKKQSVGLCACQPLESSDDKPAKDICCKTSNCNNTRT